MADEQQTNQESEQGDKQPIDESRFEVKWRKREAAPPPPPPTEERVDDVATLRGELEQERQRTKDLQERWHRAQADLVNLRRRTEQEREDMARFSTMLLVQELLPVLDNFERALTTIPGNLRMLTWIQGVMLIERHLRAILEAQGLAPIEAQGQPFNAHLHEAIAEKETSEAPPSTVTQEYQRGYTMHGRVIRPALVEVAAAPKAEPAPQPEETTPAESAEIAQEAATDNIGP